MCDITFIIGYRDISQCRLYEFIVKERLKKGETIQPVFMACGSEDFLIENNRQFRDFLNEHKVNLTYKESEGIHDWIFWNKYLEPAIEWALED